MKKNLMIMLAGVLMIGGVITGSAQAANDSTLNSGASSAPAVTSPAPAIANPTPDQNLSVSNPAQNSLDQSMSGSDDSSYDDDFDQGSQDLSQGDSSAYDDDDVTTE